MTDKPDKPKRSPETAYRPVGDDGGLVVLPARSEVKVLNPVGSAIYAMLDGTRTREQIVEAIVADFEVPRDEVARDLDAFLAELGEEGMIAEGPPE